MQTRSRQISMASLHRTRIPAGVNASEALAPIIWYMSPGRTAPSDRDGRLGFTAAPIE